MGTGSRAYDANEGHFDRAAEREVALAALASRQHGVVSVRQLLALGLTRDGIRRRVEARRLTRLHRGVYAVGHWALAPASRDLAAVLACGPQALLSHRAAGARHRLLKGAGAVPEVTAPRGCKPKPGIVIHRRRVIHPDDRDEVHGIPITSVARTIVDLADRSSQRLLTAVVNEAEVRRIFDLKAVEDAVSRLATRRAKRCLRNVLATYTEPSGYSTTEAERLLLSLCTRHDLPRPQRIHTAGYELDFYWADAQLAVEVDGRAFHASRRAFQEDRARDRVLAAQGIQVARVTWQDLTERSPELAAQLRAIRRQRLS